MSRWYFQIGVDMNHECLEKVTRDVEQLIADTKKLLNDAGDVSTQGVSEMKSEGVAMLDKALERLNESKNQVAKASDYALCKAKVSMHEHPMATLGMAALLGAVVGAIVARKVS
jgi:ElaB/YqjD/DUF883 family membrane-anchored ribosome-binding protein